MLAATFQKSSAAALLLLQLVTLSLASAIPRRDHDSSSSSFVLEHHLGNLSPYFDAPVPNHLSLGVPSGCHVDQVSLIHRHGSRGPISSEIGSVRNLSYYLNNHTSLLRSPVSAPPQRLAFLSESGWNADALKQDDLTAVGRRELFSHGVQMRLDYPHHNTTLFLAGQQDRVVESAQWFAAGYLGKDANTTGQLDLISESLGVKSYITPMESCATWTYASGGKPVADWGNVYLPPIAKQLNAEVLGVWPGLNFTQDNVHGMLWACAYDLATYGSVSKSHWCGVFSSKQIKQFEYELDLLMRGAFGYGLPNNSGQVMGSLFVSNLTQRLTQPESFKEPNGQQRSLFFDFAHDTTIDLILTSLGLAADKSYPVDGPINPARNWRTSYQVPFAAQMEWRKVICPGQQKADMIQLHLNKAPFDLGPLCKTDKFGGCDLSEFLDAEAVKEANAVQVGDAVWTAACGQ
ncbi:Histidine phosphatase superfamily, clade-2 [Kalmanozyma brasiliensis GHG001]|uniref:Acid phosphatase n=1 Tax=Kalmanozyma brasiliensis (strain GHG001) TaxID=1365824 RepID=V5E9C0_KALBG|nr:Histidine phosphatase superfamily, clade-2 [Kalmanozyma brasiliensis GHG001]EST06951.1 Histidine phosphatase superfamily, clade-2 [Kalmanozyma brasiliensis GHG001]